MREKRDLSVRAYVLVAGRHYPPMARASEVQRGHQLTSGDPVPPRTPQVFRWVVVPADRGPG